MAAPVRLYRSRCGIDRSLKLNNWLHHRMKHTNSWRNVKSCSNFEVQCGKGLLSFSTGKLARFADGAAVAQLGDSSVLVTAVSQKESKPQSFLPLTVDYRQKAAAAGRIPTNHLRRELGPSEREILTSRVIDRSIRPLFPPGYCYGTQVMCNLLAVDGANDTDIISINAASAALAVSDIPWNGPVAAVRVGMVDGEVVINPTRKQLQNSTLNIILTGTTERRIVMLEGHADRAPRNNVKQALSQGMKATDEIIRTIEKLQREVGKPKRSIDPPKMIPDHIKQAVHSFAYNHVRDVFFNDEYDKIARDEALSKVRDQILTSVKEGLSEDEECTESMIKSCYNDYVKKVFRDLILDENRRCDGRSLTDMREINCEIDLYQPLHGSALFQRGQTQVLSTVTFDSPESAIKADRIAGDISEKNFMLHYEFPPYATNETGRGGIGRRELGHGALAEKGLRAILPDQSDFTIRLTAEVLESNGSSSMASVCGGSLALMDAGVAVKEPAAGVAMGLVTRTDAETGKISQHTILTDLLGIEDYMGDMDFKIATTASGLTAIQADIKLPGVPFSMIIEALDGGFDATKQILDIMSKTTSIPRKNLKVCGPVTEKLVLDHAKQSRLVGLGGFNVKKLKTETGVTISRIDEGSFQIFAPNPDAMSEAKELIEKLLEDQKEPTLEFGAIYTGRITEIRDFGVMVELHPKLKPILLHNSQLDQRKIAHASSLGLNLGHEIKVKYFGRDPSTGNHRISRKVLQAQSIPLLRNLNTKL